MEPLSESGLSALGTVATRQLEPSEHRGDTLSDNEQRLLQHALALGLKDSDYFVVRKLCRFADKRTANLEALILCERIAVSEGGSYLDLDRKRLAGLLSSLGLESKQIGAVFRMLTSLTRKEPNLFAAPDQTGRVVPFLLDLEANRLYRHAFYTAERNIAAALKQKMNRPWRRPEALPQLLQRVTQTEPLAAGPWQGDNPPAPINLAAEQILAALSAVAAPITVISGGPGTGKTSIVTTILRLLAHLDVPLETIALAAPTGRAANRMAESIRSGLESIRPQARHPHLAAWNFEPRTLHRLLGWTPRGFLYRADNPLEADWVFVDEVSMVDLLMMERLLDALKPEANLILLGDADQLPSVAAGAVFRDLINLAVPLVKDREPLDQWEDRAAMTPGHPDRHVIQLTQSFRQSGKRGGKHILNVARKTNERAADDLFGLFEEDEHISILRPGAPLTYEGVVMIEPDQTAFPTLVEQLFQKFFSDYKRLAAQTFRSIEEDRPALAHLFDLLDQIKVLCLTRKSKFGVDNINRLFRRHFHRENRWFHPGLPWMVTRNDYRQGLYNGDIGIGLWFSDSGGRNKPMLVFKQDRAYKRIPFETLSGLDLAFAMTVHKSQGSEAKHVVLVLPEEKNALCKKEVIYTALTRAKESVTIYGAQTVLEQSVKDHMQRNSGLTDLLK